MMIQSVEFSFVEIVTYLLLGLFCVISGLCIIMATKKTTSKDTKQLNAPSSNDERSNGDVKKQDKHQKDDFQTNIENRDNSKKDKQKKKNGSKHQKKKGNGNNTPEVINPVDLGKKGSPVKEKEALKLSSKKSEESLITKDDSYDDAEPSSTAPHNSEQVPESNDVKESERSENLSDDNKDKCSELPTPTPSVDDHEKDKVQEPPSYKYFTIEDGCLKEVSQWQSPYYRTWHHNDKYYFEFYCDDDELRIVLSHHFVLIDPFCTCIDSNIDFQNAKKIRRVDPGLLDDNNNIVTKSKIQLV